MSRGTAGVIAPLLVVACLLSAAGCSRPAPAPSSAAPMTLKHQLRVRKRVAVRPPRAVPSPAATAARATATPVIARPVATPRPRPSPTLVVRAPNAAPVIFSVKLRSGEVHSGDTISGSVITSSNVASVEVRVAGFSRTMTKTAPGRFWLRYTLPSIPFFLHNTYAMTIIARNTRGDRAERTLPLTLR